MSDRVRVTTVIAAIAASATIATFGSTTYAQQQRGDGQGQTQGQPQQKLGNSQSEGTPVRQNPTINRPLTNEGISSAVLKELQELVAVYGFIGMSNDRPNPFKRVEPWGELPPNTKQWGAVIGAEGGPDGLLYVLHRCFENSCANRPESPILVLEPKTGKLIRHFGVGKYTFPHGLHVDGENNVWTADEGNHVVRKWSKDGQLLLTIGVEGKEGNEPSLLNSPTDVVTAANGDVFITEGHDKLGPYSRVSKYSKDGKFIKYLGPTKGPRAGTGPQQVSAPHAISIDSQGRLFVGDRDNNRILIWDQDGNFIDAWQQFSRPSGIYISKDDTIYVADSESWGPDNPGWKKGIRIGSARTGLVRYFIEDIESRDFVHSGPEGVGVDTLGNVYGGVVRRRMLERHEPPKPNPTRGATWTN